jgi:uncharacterized protein (TIGR03545 family)
VGGQDQQDRSVGLRRKGFIFLLIVAALFCIWSFVLSDRWLEKRLESLLGRAVGARVEIDNFDFSLFSMSVQWARLHVADPEDPWRNLFETGYCTFNLQSVPLFEKKFIVEDMSLLELRFDTERTTDGTLDLKSRQRRGPSNIQKKLEQKLSGLPLFNTDTLIGSIDVNAIWNSFSPGGPERIDELIKEYTTFSSRWDRRLAELEVEQDLTSIQDELQSIDVQRMETVEQLTGTAEKLDRAAQKAENTNETIGRQKEELAQDVAMLDTRSDAVDEWIEEDLERVRNAVQIPEITLKNIAVIMFGRKLVERVEKIIRIVEKFRSITAKIRRFIPIKELPPRLRGQDIQFAKKRTLPSLWLKSVSFSGYTKENIQISGTLRDLSSSQQITGKPIELEVAGGMSGTRNFVMKGRFDWSEPVPNDRLYIEMSNIILNDVKLTDFPLVPNNLKSGTASLKAELVLEGEELRSNILFFITDVTLVLPEKQSASPVEQRLLMLSRSVAADIRRIEIEADLAVLSDRTDFFVRSNLDALVAGEINDALEREIEGVKGELSKRVMDIAAESKQELDRIIGDSTAAVIARLGELENAGNAVEEEIERKRREVEQKIKEETVGEKKREIEEKKRKKEEQLRKELELQQEKVIPQEPEIPQELEKSIEGLF